MNMLPDYIKGERVLLQRSLPSHASAIWQYVKDNQDFFMKWQNSCWKNEKEIFDYFTKLNSDKDSKDFYYSIFLGDRIIGTVNCWDVSMWRMACQLGYEINPEYAGHGYMTEAIKLLVTELISAGFVRIKIECATENIASMKLAEKAGFICEGIMKKDVFIKSVNRFCDTAVFAIVDESNATKLEKSRSNTL